MSEHTYYVLLDLNLKYFRKYSTPVNICPHQNGKMFMVNCVNHNPLCMFSKVLRMSFKISFFNFLHVFQFIWNEHFMK